MADVLQGGPTRPPWRPPRWWPAAVAVLLAGGVTAAILTSSSGGSQHAAQQPPASAPALTPVDTPVACASPPAPPRPTSTPTVGLALATPHGRVRGYPLVGRDRPQNDPRWSIIIRRADGSLGKNEVVVTFPVSPARGGRHVDVAGRRGRLSLGTVTWAAAPPSYATLRGDLPTDEMLDIARHVTIRNGRPRLVMPDAGLTVAAAVPYEPRVTHEMRYDGAHLGAAGRALGGLVFTGVTRAAWVDDFVLESHPPVETAVGGAPAVATPQFGGNGAVAWEIEPGTIAYVGYSGAASSERTNEALACLARWSQPVSAAQWHAAVARRGHSGP